MAKFLNTSATNYFLEELIKDARDRLVLISPFLRLNDRIKELLTDKNCMKIDVRIIYGKSELQPQEISWLRDLTYLRTSFCKNLHAKCYLNEELCIITSLNLYEFSQVNNNEMGVLIRRSEDPTRMRGRKPSGSSASARKSGSVWSASRLMRPMGSLSPAQMPATTRQRRS